MRTIRQESGKWGVNESRTQHMVAELVLSIQEAHHSGFAVSYQELLCLGLGAMPPITYFQQAINLTGSYSRVNLREAGVQIFIRNLCSQHRYPFCC